MESDSGAVEGLSEVEITALREALDDEYRAHAIYTQVLADWSDKSAIGTEGDRQSRRANEATVR